MTLEDLAAIRERDTTTIGWLTEAEADRRVLLAELDRLDELLAQADAEIRYLRGIAFGEGEIG